ncbi:transposase [Algoriphagus limi]|uniref:Transposase n=1 Tax=Algoriphagus limi TaxID=2975273 RepID=A0ABT2G9L7_9BACT|nr:transposase [Algoriphagus limi]MCS5491936.1 transposase [Algoriphagus limi]
MSHSNSEIWIHWVIVTKERKPLIDAWKKEVLSQTLGKFIENNGNSHGTFSVQNDHFHLLIKLPFASSPNDFLNNLKLQIQETFIQSGSMENFLDWERKPYTYSVSLNQLSVEKNNIQRQDFKHQKVSLDEELKFFGM